MNTFPVCIWTWIMPIENSMPGKVAYIWWIERFQIDAIKFERTQIHFFVIFSLLSLSFLLKVPSVYAEWQLLESVYTVCIKMFTFNLCCLSAVLWYVIRHLFDIKSIHGSCVAVVVSKMCQSLKLRTEVVTSCNNIILSCAEHLKGTMSGRLRGIWNRRWNCHITEKE